MPVLNYTPLDPKRFGQQKSGEKKKDSGANTILLLIITLTLAVLAFMLYLLIKKQT